MSRTCELTGKTVMTGNNVSHAKNRNKRVFRPNLVNTTLLSESLEKSFSFRVATSAIRTVEHNGGLDNYLMKAVILGMVFMAFKKNIFNYLKK